MHLLIRSRLLFLFTTALLALALLAACGDDDDGSSIPDPSGEGETPLEAILPTLENEGPGGNPLDNSQTFPCPLDEVSDIPDLASRINVGQFCITSFNFEPESRLNLLVEDMQQGGIWEFELSAEDEVWRVEDIRQGTQGAQGTQGNE